MGVGVSGGRKPAVKVFMEEMWALRLRVYNIREKNESVQDLHFLSKELERGAVAQRRGSLLFMTPPRLRMTVPRSCCGP